MSYALRAYDLHWDKGMDIMSHEIWSPGIFVKCGGGKVGSRMFEFKMVSFLLVRRMIQKQTA